MESTAYPKVRHAYTYIPRPNQRGYLQYSGPLNPNLAAQQAAGMYGAGGYYGGVGPYHNRSYPTPYYGGYAGYGGYGCYGGYGSYGYGYGYPSHHRYANYYSAYQSPYNSYYHNMAYPAARVPYSYVHPSAAVPHVTYVTAAATPSRLPALYTSRDYDSRRVATERGAYRARRIKPADPMPDDTFWCRERDGQWVLRNYYSIERECQPGIWQMDAEKGFLVFHRD